MVVLFATDLLSCWIWGSQLVNLGQQMAEVVNKLAEPIVISWNHLAINMGSLHLANVFLVLTCPDWAASIVWQRHDFASGQWSSTKPLITWTIITSNAPLRKSSLIINNYKYVQYYYLSPTICAMIMRRAASQLPNKSWRVGTAPESNQLSLAKRSQSLAG